MDLNKKIIFYVVNVDWFFASHRNSLALEGLKRGYDVYLISKNTGKFKELNELGIKTIDVPFDRKKSEFLNDLKVFFKLCSLYRQYKPHIIHHVTLKPIIYGTLANVFFSKKSKIVNAVSGLGYAFSTENRSSLKSLILFFLKLVFTMNRKAIKFIFQNSYDKRIFSEKLINSKSSSFIIKGSGVNEDIFKPKNKVIKEGNVIRITLLARMLKDKGVMEFIKAAHINKEKLKGIAIFRLVGGLDFDNPAALTEQEIKNSLIDDYLIWDGKRTDIVSVYQETDIACLPSYREGMPKSLIEAMSMECAILTTNVPGCRDCVEEGVNGYLVPPRSYKALADKILFMTNDISLLTIMGLESRKKMLVDMTLSSVVNQTFKVYED